MTEELKKVWNAVASNDKTNLWTTNFKLCAYYYYSNVSLYNYIYG
jgi:hypothetical protein